MYGLHTEDTAGTSHIAILSQHNQARMCLLVMCGLPGAGKTTLTQRLQQVFTQRAVIQTRNVHSTCNEQRMPHTSWSTAGRVRCSTVCFDQVERSAVQKQSLESNKFQPAAWQKARATALALVEQHLSSNTAGEEVSSKHLIIVDDNMYYRSMRYTCFQLARKHQAAFVQLYISCPLALAQQRNAARPSYDRVPDHVLLRMDSLLQAPEPDRFPWEASTVVLAANSTADIPSKQVVESLLDKIMERWKGPVAPVPSTEAEEEARQASREANKASLAHQLDLLCRRHLSHTMQQLTSSQNKQLMASLAGKLNTARKAALAALQEADESQAQVVFHEQLTGFAQTCNSFLQSTR